MRALRKCHDSLFLVSLPPAMGSAQRRYLWKNAVRLSCTDLGGETGIR